MITAIQIVLFLSFPAFIWYKYGVLSSISAASYRLQGNAKGLFTGWLILLAVTSLFQPIGIYSGVMAIGFTMAGMSPEHRSDPNSLEDAFHTLGTIVAIAAGFAGLYFVGGVWIHAVVFAVGALALWLLDKYTPIVDNHIWWIEIWAMATIAMGLYSI